jgi:hypothetical protein
MSSLFFHEVMMPLSYSSIEWIYIEQLGADLNDFMCGIIAS